MFDVMRTPSLHEAMIKIGSFVLSEFGYLIANEPNKGFVIQFQLIKNKMPECSMTGKAILLTAFMKMTKNSAELIPLAKEVFTAHQHFWNVEIQSRSCEYLQMLEIQSSADQETRDLISNSLEKMPNFSAEIQSNNVLTKRILALKVKDGLHVNMQEAQREMSANMQRLNLNPSTAISTDQQVDEIIQNVNANTIQSQAAATMGDLLNMGGDESKPKGLMEEVKELSDLLGTSSSNN